MSKVHWEKSHTFILGELSSALKYTKNIDHALGYFKELEKWFEGLSEETKMVIFKEEWDKIITEDKCPGCGDGDPEKVGNRHKVDDGFTCEICGSTYI